MGAAGHGSGRGMQISAILLVIAGDWKNSHTPAKNMREHYGGANGKEEGG